jgi:hypothetical protein
MKKAIYVIGYTYVLHNHGMGGEESKTINNELQRIKKCATYIDKWNNSIYVYSFLKYQRKKS